MRSRWSKVQRLANRPLPSEAGAFLSAVLFKTLSDQGPPRSAIASFARCATLTAQTPHPKRLLNARSESDAHSYQLTLRNPVANPRLRENNARIVGVFFDLLPKLAHIDAQILRIFDMRWTP